MSRRLFYRLPTRHYGAGDRIRAAAVLTWVGACLGFAVGGIGVQLFGYGRNVVLGVGIATVALLFVVRWRRTLDEISGYVALPPPRDPGKLQNALEALGYLVTIGSVLVFIGESAMKLFAWNRWIFFSVRWPP